MFRPHAQLITIVGILFFVVYLLPQTSTSQATKHSLSVNGTSGYMSVPNSSTINISGPITVEAWIKLSSVNGNYQDILCREAWGQAGTGGGYEFAITSTGKVRLDLYQSHNQYTTTIGSTTVTTNTWHHVAGVFDGSQMRVYLDGVLDGSLSTTNGPATGTSALNIGKSTYTTYYFGGLIDEVRISAAALYSSNFTPGLGPGSNTRALWKFDGQTTNDVSGNGNNGTLQSGATYSTDVPATTNSAPSVTITDPQANTTFVAGSTIVIDAGASDSDGIVTRVDFYQGTTLLGSDSSSSYAFSWNNVPAGSYSLTAKAIDDNSAVTTSSVITVNVVDSTTNHSLSLNGTSGHVKVPNSTSINISGAITIEAWIKLNSVNGNYQDIVCREAWGQVGSGGGYEFAITSTGKVRLDLYQSHNQYTTAIGATTVTTNVWHHVAGVFDGSQMRVYLDGVLDGSLSTTNGPASGTSVLNIGKSTYTTYYFGGLIDEVRLSAAALYSSNFTPGLGPGSNTRALWKFDGQTTNDTSGNGNNGTLQTGGSYSTDVPPQSGGQRPIAVAGGPYNGQPSQTVQFSSSGSFDPDGTIGSYHWNFGDSTSANSANPTHTYAAPGLYTATLTVTDNAGLRASRTAVVTINGATNARLDALNQVGGGGENPLSRNFNLNLPLVSLPGRAGMDLGLSLSYNSLVWTKTGSYISFDDDHGFPSPGFRLGFPVIQPLYYNAEVGKYAFLLIGSDGTRTELRQVGTSSHYEAADSSHLLLNSNGMILSNTDGTQLNYVLMGNEYNCTQIKDRNGNYITVNYTPFGRIDTVVDTLARSIKFNYDAYGWLTAITQIWNQGSANEVTHNWATFTYSNTTIQTAFNGLTVVGPANDSAVKTLSAVTLADGSHSDFSYTNWGQVWKVSEFAADGVTLLNYRAYNLPGSPLLATSAQLDCPRFSERRDWARYWNGDLDGSAVVGEEAVTNYAGPVDDTWTMPGASSSVSGTRVQVTAPDGTSDKIYFVGTAGNTTTGWQRGLPALVKSYDETNTLQRQVQTTWVQDNDAAYIINPRVSETNIYDSANHRKSTSVSYQTETIDGTLWRLPQDVYEYQADSASIVLRRRHTDYYLADAYITRRIIGLPSTQTLYEINPTTSVETLSLKVGFQYDGGSIEPLPSPEPVQHDGENYGSGSVIVRGNVSSVKRYDVNNENQFTTTTIKYNAAGSVVSTADPLTHTITLSYTDSFSDGVSRNTLAYPTTVTDPDQFSSSAKYNFDFGAVTWKQTPQPNVTTNTPGPQLTMEYDSIGRLQRTTNSVNNAYTRFIYGPNYMESWTTVNTLADEEHALQVFDGAGRVIGRATNHPGSTGGFSGQRFIYDVVGRMSQESNPTETSVSITGATINPSSWSAMGDDTVANGGFGWLFKQQTYDWKGRPLVTTNTDGTTKSVNYSVCGCAGSDVMTITDEGTMAAGVAKKRQQKLYSDTLGRTWKTEVLNWDGSGPNGTNGSVYATTVASYNARDQVTQIRQYTGTEDPLHTFQDTTLSYDGYGRLQTKHVPEQALGKVTTWTYNNDDTIESVVDGRGAVTTFTYNQRHLTTAISSTLSGSSTIGESFTYDAAGNRKTMSHTVAGIEQDNASYSYDALSRMTSETKHITALGSNFMGGNYTIGYAYTLSAQLQSITDPFNSKTDYEYDNAGRLISAVGNYGGVARNYLGPVQYRAWGGIKSMTFNGGTVSTVTYNTRMLPAQFRGSPGRFDYSYHSDGRIRTILDLDDQVGPPSQVQFHYMSREYSYDQSNRVSAVSGFNPGVLPPFSGSYGYDAFGNMTNRTGNYALNQTVNDSSTYSNNRRTGWTYDDDGRVKISPDPTTSGTRSWTYDAVGNRTFVAENVSSTTATNTLVYDGDDELLKDTVVNNSYTSSNYLINSSVLGKVLVKLDASGGKDTTYVAVNDYVTPLEQKDSQGNLTIGWVARDASGLQENDRAADPFGNLINNVQPPVVGSPPNIPFYGPGYMNPSNAAFTNANNYAMSCVLDGITAPCTEVMNAVNHGNATQCPDNYCGPRFFTVGGQPAGVLISNGAGYWASDGKSSENLFLGDVRYGSLLDGLIAHFRNPQTKSTKKGTRVSPQPGGPQKPKYPPVTRSEINVVYGGAQFEFIEDEIVDAIVDIANRQACSDAFKKYSLTIPYDLVKSGKLRVAGRAALYQSNATELLGWDSQQVENAKDTFDKEKGIIGSGWRVKLTADMVYHGIPTVVFNPLQVRWSKFGGLKEVVTHAFIHLGGQPGDPGAETHDLSNFKGYKEIVDTCR